MRALSSSILYIFDAKVLGPTLPFHQSPSCLDIFLFIKTFLPSDMRMVKKHFSFYP